VAVAMVYVDPLLRGKALNKLEANGRVNITDAAAILGLHKVTVRDYIDKGKIEAITISNRSYIFRSELDRFIEERKG
jgi:excisionase family DNA binding protein